MVIDILNWITATGGEAEGRGFFIFVMTWCIFYFTGQTIIYVFHDIRKSIVAFANRKKNETN